MSGPWWWRETPSGLCERGSAPSRVVDLRHHTAEVILWLAERFELLIPANGQDTGVRMSFKIEHQSLGNLTSCGSIGRPQPPRTLGGRSGIAINPVTTTGRRPASQLHVPSSMVPGMYRIPRRSRRGPDKAHGHDVSRRRARHG